LAAFYAELMPSCWDQGRFLGIKARQAGREKMPKNRAEKTA
jgi:hypothetical protein